MGSSNYFNQIKYILKKKGVVILFLAFGLSSFAQQNIAPLATVTANGSRAVGCASGGCEVLNDLILGDCNSDHTWIVTSIPPSTTVGDDYIEWNFPSVQTFDSLIIHHGLRPLTGATVQFWNGSAWVTHSSFTNLPQQCINRIGIGKLTTDRFRITLFEMTTSRNFNPSFREIEIIEAPIGFNNAGVSSIDFPNVFCPSVQDVWATIRNYGMN